MKIQRELYILYLSIAVASLGIGIVVPLIPLIIKESGASTFMVGLAATLMALSFALASFPIGRIIDKIGTKKILIFGLIIYSIPILAFPYFNNIIMFSILRIIEGIGWAAVWMSTETSVNQISAPENRARNMGYYGSSVAIGMAVGPIIGMYLIQTSIFLPFYFCFGLSLFTATLAGIFLKSMVFKAEGVEEVNFSTLAKSLQIPLGAAFVYGFFESSMIALLPIYLIANNISSINLGTIISAFIVGGILFQLPAGVIADRIGKERSLAIFTIMLGIGSFLAPLHSNLYYLMVIAIIIGAFGGALYPVGLSMIADKTNPAKLGSANATFTSIYGVGSIIGPLISALLMEINTHFLFAIIIPMAVIYIYLILSFKLKLRTKNV